ncbi:MAG: DUF4465 domain-containing protein [Bacteroidia bacterium]
MKSIFTLTFYFLIYSSIAQVDNFENLVLEPETFWNGSDGSADYFETESFYFPTFWDTGFGGYWAGGWSYSNMTDSVTSGFMNQYSAKTGSGYLNSENYAIAYGDGWFRPRSEVWQYVQPTKVRITNTTFAYNSMRDGDSFAKKFGGLSGNDADYFTITFQGFFDGQSSSSEDIVFYLADYRFEDNSLDYILKDWVELDLSSLQFADSIRYTFNSSDIEEFGINTPVYFCLDNLEYLLFVNSLPGDLVSNSKLYPNPAAYTANLTLKNSGEAMFQVYSIDGKMVQNGFFYENTVIDVSNLESGVYIVNVLTDSITETHRLIKN